MSKDGPLFHKFNVTRTDGTSELGGKHDGCEYFVLDITHDQHAKAALTAYANSAQSTHPELAADMRAQYGLAAQPAELPELPVRRAIMSNSSGPPMPRMVYHPHGQWVDYSDYTKLRDYAARAAGVDAKDAERYRKLRSGAYQVSDGSSAYAECCGILEGDRLDAALDAISEQGRGEGVWVMAKYNGGPFDGMQISTRYDHLPVIRIPYPRDSMMSIKSVECYELRNGGRFHIASKPSAKPSMTAIDEARGL